MVPADVLTMMALQSDPDLELRSSSLPPDVSIEEGIFKPEYNLISLWLQSEFYEPIPATFKDGKWSGEWPHQYLALDPVPHLSGGDESLFEPDEPDFDADRPTPSESVDPADFPPAPDFMGELRAHFERTGNANFPLRALSFTHAQLLSLLKCERIEWEVPFDYPPDTRVLGVIRGAPDRWIFWCLHPEFEPCQLHIEPGVGPVPVQIEIPGDGIECQYRIEIPGLTAGGGG